MDREAYLAESAASIRAWQKSPASISVSLDYNFDAEVNAKLLDIVIGPPPPLSEEELHELWGLLSRMNDEQTGAAIEWLIELGKVAYEHDATW